MAAEVRRLLDDGSRRRRSRSSIATRPPSRRCWAGLRRLGVPSRWNAGRVRAHPAGPAGWSRCCAARCWTAARRICWPPARPVLLPSPSSPTRWRRERARRARTAPTRRTSCGKPSTGGWMPSSACARRTAAAAPSCWNRRHRACDPFAAPPARRRRGAHGPGAQGRTPVLRAGRIALDQLAAITAMNAALAPRPAQLADLLDELEVFTGPGRVPGLVPSPSAAPARAARPARCLPAFAGARLPFAAGRRAVFGDPDREEIAVVSGLRLRRRDELGASDTCSTRRSRGPRSACTCPGTTPPTTATKRCDRSSSRTSATSSVRIVAAQAHALSLARSGGRRDAPTERERSRGAAAGGRDIGGVDRRAGRSRARRAAARQPAWSASGIELWASSRSMVRRAPAAPAA